MATLKHHHIKIKKTPTDGDLAGWESHLRKVVGVTNVKINLQDADVYVEYDLSKCCEESIEHWMVKAGFVLDDSLLQRFKRGCIHYTDENAQDALRSTPHSCCNVEEVERKRKSLK